METSLAVSDKLGLPSDRWSISFQSRLGPVKWLTPSTSDKVRELVGRGVTNLAIVAPAFLADGLETLEELDIGIREEFEEHGGEKLTVIKCLNDNPDWIAGLTEMVEGKFAPSVTA